MTTSLPSLIPANDASRLAALNRYQLLDARREKVLDDVVAATARLFRVANAMLSIVEESSVLVKAPFNLPGNTERVPRAQSLCSATILQNDTVVFEDVDQSSAPGVDTSLVKQLGLHFYAGHNLRTPDGHNIGTLCLLDGPPRHFALIERHLLGQLASLVMHLLELRRLLGPHHGITAIFWDAIYRAMSEQLNRLGNLAETTTAAGASPLTPAKAQEAGSIVRRLDDLVTATLRQK
ncbi:GAF domain-containing protein [Hymenobacter rubidus]|uniref:GAF domain-containing protein n=1 Tax=Hymenobacter rubidus TaxID=1441626 RepID=UPI00191D371C|nr:GAF domain-containing protein [Hymenobacter rubidus]